MDVSSGTNILLLAIVKLLQGTPMPFTVPKLSSPTEQLLYQIYILLGGGGGGGDFIRPDGSRDFNSGVTQKWPNGAIDGATVDSGKIRISQESLNKFCTLLSNGRIEQCTIETGANDFVIGKHNVEAIGAPSGTIDIMINGTLYKIPTVSSV